MKLKKLNGRSGDRLSKVKPVLEWQTGKYDRQQKFEIIMPYPFLLLCRTMNVTPENVIRDFLDNLSCGSWNRKGRELAKEKLVDYFIEHKYGQEYFSFEDIRKIFRELDAIGLLFPDGAREELIDLHVKWRDEYYNYWFEKWQNMPIRRS